MLEYQLPSTSLTLEEGLREYYASREGLVGGRGVSPEATEFFRCHDIAHVVFGCSTDLLDEAIVKIWSLFGTTGGLGLLRGYRLPESQDVYEQLKLGEVVATTIRSIAVAPVALWRCRRMQRRWPWSDFEPYLGVPLCEIRNDFGIELVQR